jgi:AraC-like DNA-binding protein
MSEFASAAMVRVVAQGMRQLGLEPGPIAPAATHARVDLDLKRMLLGRAVALGGLRCLPLLGRGLHQLTHEPTHLALVSARHVPDLLERWQRLERYVHSRHRCVVDTCTSRTAVVRHVCVGDGAPPSAAEDLVVAGVLAALVESIGLQRVQVWIGDVMAYPDPQADPIERACSERSTGTWQFCWTGTVNRAETAGFGSSTQELGADPTWCETTRSAYQRLLTDLTRPLSLAELAADLGLPLRTLQRRLADGGISYSQLLAEARCRAGAWRLLHTLDPIAEVGFLSGFTDQPHFTREMQRRVGMPPAAYRRAFTPLVGHQAASTPSELAGHV